MLENLLGKEGGAALQQLVHAQLELQKERNRQLALLQVTVLEMSQDIKQMHAVFAEIMPRLIPILDIANNDLKKKVERTQRRRRDSSKKD